MVPSSKNSYVPVNATLYLFAPNSLSGSISHVYEFGIISMLFTTSCTKVARYS